MKRSFLLAVIMCLCLSVKGQSLLEDTYFTISYNNNQHGSILKRPVGDIFSFDAASFSFGVEKYLSNSMNVTGTFSTGKVMFHGNALCDLYGVDLNLKYKFNNQRGFFESAMKPYFSFGLGMRRLQEGGAERMIRYEFLLTPEIGVDYAVSDKFKLSLSAAYIAGGSTRYREYSLGVGFSIARKKDTDKDGIRDKLDRCPLVPGFGYNKGCPHEDADNDGVIDAKDLCPYEPGSLNGCPDIEEEKNNERLEEQPLEAIDRAMNLESAVGKPVDSSPVVDSDKDRLPDRIDDCPVIKGNAINHGCPFYISDVLKRGTVYFNSGETAVSPKYEPGLKKIIAVMESGNFGINLIDHVDDPGLSVKRTQNLIEYFVQRGIGIDRLKIVSASERIQGQAPEVTTGKVTFEVTHKGH